MPRAPIHGRPTPPSKLTDAEVAERWRVLTPNFFRYLILFVVASVGLFAYNRFAKPGQEVTNVINVAFQISCALSVYYVLLCGMAIYYGRQFRKQTQSAQ